MDSQYPVGLGICEELHETIGVQVGLRSRVGGEGELSSLVLDTSSLELLFVLTNPCNLGVRVHDGGDRAVVDVTVALVDVLDGSNSLLLGLVGEHGSESAVTDGADVGDLCAVFLVNDQAAPLVSLETNVVQTETRGVWAAADCDKYDVSVDLRMLAIFERERAIERVQSLPFRPLQPQRGPEHLSPVPHQR